MTRRTLTDLERIAGLREVIAAANGDWHEATALWSVQADLDWLLALCPAPAPETSGLREALAPIADGLPRLRRIAREAEGTYVGRHWPSMADMRRDGIGSGLVEGRAHERFIRRYLDTFQPAFVVDLLDQLAAALATERP